ncbi:MAG: hypothetical protein U0L88_04840 [Acutalibacteraceae bacterium]|nr:hypothetical protein [Acutalibacteraceae bacterium]
MDSMITMEQFEAINDAKVKASNDDTPYIGMVDGTVNVNGDPNKTEIKPADYEVLFAFPNTDLFRKRIDAVGDEIVKEEGGYIIVKRVYKGVYLTPRKMSDAVTAGAVIESFLNKVTENGEIKALSYDELKDVIVDNFTEMKDSAYDLVASVLRIHPEEAEWMLPMHTVNIAIQIAMNNPALENESNFFTELSLDNL